MCGRFTLFLDPEDIQDFFELEKVAEWRPRYNVAPSQDILAIISEQPNAAMLLRWGITIHSARENRDIPLINIKAETFMEKRYFRPPNFNPCLILANGFYEWYKPEVDGKPQPVYFHLKSQAIFAFAGLWNYTTLPNGERLKTGAILTCPPNEQMAPIHNRMPVMLEWPAARNWLAVQNTAEAAPLLNPLPEEKLAHHVVGKWVNSPAHDAPDCITPA